MNKTSKYKIPKLKFIKLDRNKLRVQAVKTEKSVFKHAHKFVVKRWEHLSLIKTRILIWILLLSFILVGLIGQNILNNNSYKTYRPATGGTYREGVVGMISTFNPLYAETNSEKAVAKLIYSSIYKFDKFGQIKNDLARSTTISEDNKTYTIILREGVKWHDGQKLNAEDVEFTVNLIKNPKLNLAFAKTWKDVKTRVVGDYTIEFTLPDGYNGFKNSLTFSILPKHILENTDLTKLKENSFNSSPVGSGPFKFSRLQNMTIKQKFEQIVHLVKNENYYDGVDKLDRFELHTFETNEDMAEALQDRDLSAASNIPGMMKLNDVNIKSNPVNNGVYAFFNVDRNQISSAKIRQAIRYGMNVLDARKKFETRYGKFNNLDYPVLASQLDSSIALRPINYLTESDASKYMTEAGYVKSGGKWLKDGKNMTLKMVTIKNSDYAYFAELIADNLRKFGIDIQLGVVDINDKNQNFGLNTIRPREYDILVYELKLGYDMDVFAYWHSSQKSESGFNLSNYSNQIVDDSLISSRNKEDLYLRSLKYKSFIDEWVNDTPAVGLYQPNYFYAQTKTVSSFDIKSSIISPEYRFFDVTDWSVEANSVYQTP